MQPSNQTLVGGHSTSSLSPEYQAARDGFRSDLDALCAELLKATMNSYDATKRRALSVWRAHDEAGGRKCWPDDENPHKCGGCGSAL